MDAHRLGFRAETETFVALRRLEIPTLASINGVCVGAGFDMVAAMDLVVQSSSARYQVAYVKRGLYPDLGGFWALPKVIGWRKAMEMMLTGRFMSAEEAHEAGLSNYLVAPEDLEAKTMELALEIEAGPAIAQRLAKMLAHRTANQDYETALEWSGTALPIVMSSEDRVEGVRSFLEKRAPRFEGR
jgi:enoyl-CoA hydratase/carnithine racemase